MFPGTNIISAPSAYNSFANGGKSGGVFWVGGNGKVYVSGQNGTNEAGKFDGNTRNYWEGRGFKQISDPNPANYGKIGTIAPIDPSQLSDSGIGIGSASSNKTLDTAGLQSLDSLIASFDTIRNQAKLRAALKRDAAKNEKEEEKTREEGKYKGKKLSTLQDFAGAKTDTDLNTRNTLENLVSSLSVLGLGGSRALTRQILDASNKANRKANATQATNNRDLDASWNDYTVGNENDVKKIEDQYGYDAGEAEKKYLQDKQSAMYKKADIYNAVDDTGNRSRIMGEADGLNNLISRASFMNPSYTGKSRQMATPELGDYTQDIAKYDTTNIGASDGGLTPASANGANVPGNLAVRAIAVNDKDLGIKKRTESELGYGV